MKAQTFEKSTGTCPCCGTPLPDGFTSDVLEYINKMLVKPSLPSGDAEAIKKDAEQWAKKCTRPDCNCILLAELKAGGPVKSYECLARVDMLMDKTKPPMPVVNVKKEIEDIRNWVYNQLPIPEALGWQLLQLLAETIKRLDLLTEKIK